MSKLVTLAVRELWGGISRVMGSGHGIIAKEQIGNVCGA